MSTSTRALYARLAEAERRLQRLLDADADGDVRVRLLHRYNDVKDAAQVVIGHLANLEGTAVSEIHARLELQE